MTRPLLEIEGVSKTFPGLQALHEVGFAVESGEIVALVGQNGSGGNNLIENFNGTSWSVVAAPGFSGGSHLTGISASSSTDIFASGSEGRKGSPEVLQFNGTSWNALSTQPTGQEAATSILAISSTDVWVARTKGLQNFNGTSWSVVSAPNAGFSAISGTSANNSRSGPNNPV